MLKVNLKNDKGITLLIVIIIVIMLIILTGATLSSEVTFMDDLRAGRYISNMKLVQAKVENIMDDYEFSDFSDESLLVGDRVYFNVTDAISTKEIDLLTSELGVSASDIANLDWYRWDAGMLESQGLNKKMLAESEYFYINYDFGEIISPRGVTYENVMYYSLTGIEYVYENM